MKRNLSAVLALSLAVATPGLAADKSTKKKTPAIPSTVPPTSKMITIAPPDGEGKSNEPQKLISSEMSGQDLQFFTSVVEAGRTQVFLIDLLKTRAQSEQIKALADALSGTQEQENRQISKLAAAKGWTVSTDPTGIQKALGAQLEKQSGADFDKAVMDKVIAASQQSVSAYEAAAQSADKDIKAFAEQILPLAREKLQLVERMTGVGKAANKFLRTGEPPKPAPVSSPKPQAGATPPAIISSKAKPATPAAKQATIPSAEEAPAKNQ